jgi:hypothetical protein
MCESGVYVSCWECAVSDVCIGVRRWNSSESGIDLNWCNGNLKLAKRSQDQMYYRRTLNSQK